MAHLGLALPSFSAIPIDDYFEAVMVSLVLPHRNRAVRAV